MIGMHRSAIATRQAFPPGVSRPANYKFVSIRYSVPAFLSLLCTSLRSTPPKLLVLWLCIFLRMCAHGRRQACVVSGRAVPLLSRDECFGSQKWKHSHDAWRTTCSIDVDEVLSPTGHQEAVGQKEGDPGHVKDDSSSYEAWNRCPMSFMIPRHWSAAERACQIDCLEERTFVTCKNYKNQSCPGVYIKSCTMTNYM